MAASKIMRIVRSVTGKGGTIYNDRLQGGVRSVKIGYGTNTALNSAVMAALEAAGYRVRMVKGWRWWGRDAYRMHVE